MGTRLSCVKKADQQVFSEHKEEENDDDDSDKSDESIAFQLLEEQNEDLLKMVHLLASCIESKLTKK